MASYSGFIRKAPKERLRRFLEARGVVGVEDCDWSSDGPQTAFVRSIDKSLDGLPSRQQDSVRADLDLLASIADQDGLVAAERICAGHGVDIEGMQGVEDILLMLATEQRKVLERIEAEASMMRRSGGAGWAAFQFHDDGRRWALDDVEARDAFLEDAIAILDLPAHRKREADWFKSIRVHPITGEETEIVQATIYVEARAESELAFGTSNTLERQTVSKVLEVGIACDAENRIVEICAKGGKRSREKYAAAFGRHFAPHAEAPLETPRRDVLLDVLRAEPLFVTEPADGIERVEVSTLDFFSSGGGFLRIERRGDDETIYQFLNKRFGAASPLRASGWSLTGATVRIILSAVEGRRRRTLTVTLRTPNTTTLPNTTDEDRRFAFSLLERWGLIARPPENVEVLEATA